MIACDSGGCCASNSSVISSDMQNVVADSFYQGQVTFTYFSEQPVNAYVTIQKDGTVMYETFTLRSDQGT